MGSQKYDIKIPPGRIDISLKDNLEITTLKFIIFNSFRFLEPKCYVCIMY